MSTDASNLDNVLGAYIECALWSSTDPDADDDSPLDENYGAGDLAPETLAAMRADCADILAQCESEGIDLGPIEPEQFGHDFWLTRNRHGAGFWDRDLGALGDRLTDVSHAYGEVTLYAGDDGRLYV